MTTLDSSSGPESGMDEQNSTKTQFQTGSGNEIIHRRHNGQAAEGEEDEVAEGGGGGRGDEELWNTFSKSFRQVQSVLDQNRVLIQQVNENHQSKIPDNLTKNVALIREINGNIAKVASMYSNLSSNFTDVFHQKSVIKNKGQSSEA